MIDRIIDVWRNFLSVHPGAVGGSKIHDGHPLVCHLQRGVQTRNSLGIGFVCREINVWQDRLTFGDPAKRVLGPAREGQDRPGFDNMQRQKRTGWCVRWDRGGWVIFLKSWCHECIRLRSKDRLRRHCLRINQLRAAFTAKKSPVHFVMLAVRTEDHSESRSGPFGSNNARVPYFILLSPSLLNF